MTRYPPEHKEKSRIALVQAAAGLFRRHGYSGVGINDLCGAAGFTRGAFYAHFNSKAGLLKAVLSGGHDMLRRLRERQAKTGAALAREGAGIAADYLKLENRQAVLGGCSLAALALCVGGLLISSACGDSSTAQAVSRAATKQVKRLLAAKAK